MFQRNYKRARRKLKNIFSALLDFVFPRSCELCCQPSVHSGLCSQCLVRIRNQFSLHEKEFEGRKVYYLFNYSDDIRKLIISYKYKKQYHLSALFGDLLTKAVNRIYTDKNVTVTGIPVFKEHFTDDHIWKICTDMASRGIRCEKLIEKSMKNIRQVGLGRAERKKNVKGVFRSVKNLPPETRVIIIDDVITTGATFSEAAAMLGCQVTGLMIAHGEIDA